MKKIIKIILFLTILILAGLLYFRYQVYYSNGGFSETVVFEVKKGEGIGEISQNLRERKLISGKIYFFYYLKNKDLSSKILPGNYQLSGKMTIPEIVLVISNPQEDFLKITFPEGWSLQEMGDRLEENGISKKDFLELAGKPENFSSRYPFLAEEGVKNLEGYLFPDTYYFKKEAPAQEVIEKMLANFSRKFTKEMQADLEKSGRSLRDIIILASIVEMEVRSQEDRGVVSGIFWKRLEMDMPLQSDITLTYALGIKKGQYSLEDTQFDSPYNTYKNKGLPPGPIGNPGISAISATLYPKQTDYLYFLSNLENGQTVFAKTFEEHVKNKKENGL